MSGSAAKIGFDVNDKQRLLERFLRYVRMDTRSDDSSATSPSTPSQKDLAAVLVEELKALGCADAAMDEWGYVTATVESNLSAGHPAAGRVPVIGLLAHMDTYFGTSGAGVKPQIHLDYPGGDLPLPGVEGMLLREAENPNLSLCKGHTIVTTDGTTLLGADDKAGIAEIVSVVDWLRGHPELLHGRIRIGFTTDEEIGRGTEHFDVAKFGAGYAYTLDGADAGEVEDETFCADSAVVTFTGHDVHPGYAKGRMHNAVRAAAALIDRLPVDHLPETTDERQSYLHAYDVKGDVSKAEVKVLVRAFTNEELLEREDSLRAVVAEVGRLFPGVAATVEIRESYRNMGFKIAEDPKVVEYAFEAVRRIGIEPKRKAIRGGTDGARLSYMGLLTPNVWAGGQNFHSVNEWVSVEWMASAVLAVLNLLDIWVERSSEG